MPRDRDQQTPDDPEDWARLQSSRGQGTAATGLDRLPGEEAPAEFHDEGPFEDPVGES
jgi:hypothetical protein